MAVSPCEGRRHELTEPLTDRRYSPRCLYADSAYEYAEYMKPSEILHKIYCILEHIEKIWYNKCRGLLYAHTLPVMSALRLSTYR